MARPPTIAAIHADHRYPLVLALLLCATLARAEINGVVVTKAAGSPAMVARDGRAAALADAAELILHSGEPLAATTLAILHRPFWLHWSHAERLATRIVAADDVLIRLDTSIGAVELPADRLVALERREPTTRLLHADFLAGVAPLTAMGAPPRLDHVATPPRAIFEKAGQSLVLHTPTGHTAFRLRARFHDPGGVHKETQWRLALKFGSAVEPAVLLTLGADSAMHRVQAAAAPPSASSPLPRATGWHDLEIFAQPGQLTIAIDNASVFSWLLGAPTGNLVEAKFEMTHAAPDGPVFAVAAVTLEAPFNRVTRMLTDADRCDVMRRDGEQLFASAWRATSEAVLLTLAKGQSAIALPWDEIESVWPPRSSDVAEPLRWDGEIGELTLRDESRILVELRLADTDAWTVAHPLLGERRVPTAAIARWTPRVIGSRMQWLSRPLRLGSRHAPTLPRAQPEADHWRALVTGMPDRADWSMECWVWGLNDRAELNAAAARTEVWRGGVKSLELDDQVRGGDAPRRLRAPLIPPPIGAADAIEVRLTVDPGTGLHDEIMMGPIAVEADRRSSAKKETP